MESYDALSWRWSSIVNAALFDRGWLERVNLRRNRWASGKLKSGFPAMSILELIILHSTSLADLEMTQRSAV